MTVLKITIQVALIALLFYITFAIIQLSDQFHIGNVWQYRTLFLNGWLTTVSISVAVLFFSTFVGLCIAFAKNSSLTLIRVLSRVFIEIVRGSPLLVQILFFYYVVAHAIGLENRMVAAIVILSLFNGAYIAEMIRAAIDTVSGAQMESARAIGLTPYQSYRFVVFPQAIRHVLPPISGQFASMIKDSSLLSVIGINELTNAAQQINSATYSTLEVFFPLALAYLLLTLPISLFSKKLERIFYYET